MNTSGPDPSSSSSGGVRSGVDHPAGRRDLVGVEWDYGLRPDQMPYGKRLFGAGHKMLVHDDQEQTKASMPLNCPVVRSIPCDLQSVLF